MKIAVTGAFGYTGRYIAQQLLDEGHDIMTLTNHPGRANPFGDRVRAYPYHFDQPDRLTESLKGVDALINTYWIRFDTKRFRQRDAIANLNMLFTCAREAGVRRIVHASIANPDIHSPYPYYRGKAEVEEALRSAGVSWCILRPTVIFGNEDILINNIAWVVRHVPVFGIAGDGSYKIQPVFVGDFARLAAQKVEESRDEVIDAIGPETFTFRELVEEIANAIGVKRPIVSVSPALQYFACRAIGWVVCDVILTREEIDALMAGLLAVDSPPAGSTKLTDWMPAHRDTLGRRYASELARRVRKG